MCTLDYTHALRGGAVRSHVSLCTDQKNQLLLPAIQDDARSPTSCDQATNAVGPLNRAQKRKDRKNAVASGIEKMAQVSEHDQGELQFMNHPSGTPCA